MVVTSGTSIPVASGSPAERARAVLAAFPDMADVWAELAAAPADLDAADRRWLHRCWDRLVSTFPEVAEYVDATASALDTRRDLLLAGSHRVLLDRGARIPDEGCSVVAGSHAEVGAFLAKNRDNPPAARRLHTIVEHVDPAWEGRSVLALSSYGACMAASSGINSAGFALADTAIPIAGAAPGILRFYLMDALLGRCTTVAEALEIVAPIAHLGGTLTMIDATGAVAALDLAQAHPEIEAKDNGTVARTNHYTGAGAAEEHRTVDGRSNSECRRQTVDRLAAALGEEAWTATRGRILATLSSHDGEGAPCRHDTEVHTNGTVVFTARPVTVHTSLGQPCSGPWVDWPAD